MSSSIKLTILTLAILTSSCSDYWWERGQPPHPEKLLQSAGKVLVESQQANAGSRDDIATDIEKISSKINALSDHLAADSTAGDSNELVKDVSSSLAELEGKISVPSRAAYGELAGQWRLWAKKDISNTSFTPALQLLSSRTLRFMAREISSPKPN